MVRYEQGACNWWQTAVISQSRTHMSFCQRNYIREANGKVSLHNCRLRIVRTAAFEHAHFELFSGLLGKLLSASIVARPAISLQCQHAQPAAKQNQNRR